MRLLVVKLTNFPFMSLYLPANSPSGCYWPVLALLLCLSSNCIFIFVNVLLAHRKEHMLGVEETKDFRPVWERWRQRSKRVREGGIWCAVCVALLYVSAAPVRDGKRLASWRWLIMRCLGAQIVSNSHPGCRIKRKKSWLKS